jgi:hypothetical protein
MARQINLGGGKYIKNVAGDYVQGSRVIVNASNQIDIDVIDVELEVIETIEQSANPKRSAPINYVEHLGGEVIKGDKIN